MRKTYVYASLLVAVVGFLFFFAGSCTKSDGLPPYYIKFNFDGEEVVFDLGVPGIENDPFASVSPGDGTDSALFFATPETTDLGNIPGNYIVIRISNSGELGSIEYTYPAPEVGGSLDDIVYNDDISGYLYAIASGSLTVTSFGDVGEAISGTFYATLSYLIPQSVKVTASTIQVTEGKFKVKRAEDGFYSPFPE